LNAFEAYLQKVDQKGERWVVDGIPKPRGLLEWRDRSAREEKIRENLQFRADAIEWVRGVGKEGEDLVWQMCKEFPLFYWNVFNWTYDPRLVDSPAIPFVTWPFQDEALMDMTGLIGRDDVVIEKSRDMGASWQLLYIFEQRWHFFPMQSFLLGSRKEDFVDKPGVSDTLFWKIDFIHENLPGWLMPNIDRVRLHIGNKDNGSAIDGESTTGDFARGGRRTAIGLDEFAAVEQSDGYRVLASTQAVTNSRFFNSTPQGMGNAYADMAHKPDTTKIRFHWSIHPEKSEGLYTSEKDHNKIYRLKIIDEVYDFGPGFPFILDGKLRSPWYDSECKRTPIPSVIAQELDIDYLGSGALFFDVDLIQELMEETVLKPFVFGEFDYVPDSEDPPTFIEREQGRVKLWMLPDPSGAFPVHMMGRKFVVGCDVAVGTGATPSTMSIVDESTGEKVGEFADNNTRPEQWAELAIMVCRWFSGAKLIWESNGPGQTFGSTVLKSGYGNIWYRENETTVTRRRSDIPGWASTKETKRTLLGEYHQALAKRKYVNRSRRSLQEALEYVHHGGGVEHSKALAANDPLSSGANHGDHVIADALSWRGIRDTVMIQDKQDPEDPPEGSMAWRMKQRRQQEQQSKAGW
jgi:hypothetical protein